MVKKFEDLDAIVSFDSTDLLALSKNGSKSVKAQWNQVINILNTNTTLSNVAYLDEIVDLFNGSTATTQASTDNTTKIATTAFVNTSMLIHDPQQFTATAGQTTFTLDESPSKPTQGILTLNGQVQDYTTDYTLSGISLNWLGSPVLINGDKLTYYYPLQLN